MKFYVNQLSQVLAFHEDLNQEIILQKNEELYNINHVRLSLEHESNLQG